MGAAPPSADRLGRVRSGLVAAVTALAAAMAALASLVSFEAISAYVAGIGALPAWLRWCGPLLVDIFITLGTLFLLWLALSGIPLRRVWDAWYAWVLIAAATGASAYLNHRFERTAQRTSAFRSSLAPGATGEVEVAGFVGSGGWLGWPPGLWGRWSHRGCAGGRTRPPTHQGTPAALPALRPARMHPTANPG